MNTIETTVIVKDQNGNVITTYNQTQSLPTTVTGIDLEHEVVYSGGSPIVRPKNAPKY